MSYVSQKDVPDDICAVCHESLKDPTQAVFKLNCGHFFHNNCLNDYCDKGVRNHEPKCPLCQTPFDLNDCNTFYAFKTKSLYPTDFLPKEVKHIYEEQPDSNQEAGNYRKTRAKRKTRKTRTKRRTRKMRNKRRLRK